jgi:hypothetical protein
MIQKNLNDQIHESYFDIEKPITDWKMPVQSCIQNLGGIVFSQGNCSNLKSVYKFGKATSVGTSMVDINFLATPAVYAWLTAATKLEVLSSDANDTAAGTGARTVYLEGLDANWNLISETVSLNGATPVVTVNDYLRFHRFYVNTCGTYNSTTTGPHTGNITVRVQGGGAIQGYIASEFSAPLGQSQICRYTIPAGYTGYLSSCHFTIDNTKQASFYIWQRQNGATLSAAPYFAKRNIITFEGLVAPFQESFMPPIKLTERTDVWTSVRATATNTEVSNAFTIYMFKNT